MAHFINILFFATVLIGSVALISLMVRSYWSEILAALVGEIPVRETSRPWTGRVRVTVRPRPQIARAAQRRAAA